jgi:hypothetical protein
VLRFSHRDSLSKFSLCLSLTRSSDNLRGLRRRAPSKGVASMSRTLS